MICYGKYRSLALIAVNLKTIRSCIIEHELIDFIINFLTFTKIECPLSMCGGPMRVLTTHIFVITVYIIRYFFLNFYLIGYFLLQYCRECSQLSSDFIPSYFFFVWVKRAMCPKKQTESQMLSILVTARKLTPKSISSCSMMHERIDFQFTDIKANDLYFLHQVKYLKLTMWFFRNFIKGQRDTFWGTPYILRYDTRLKYI